MSKLNGRRSKVIGNSFIISTNTRTPPASIEGLIRGIVIEVMVPKKLIPRVLLAHIRFGEVLSNPERVDPYPTAKNRVK